MRASVSVTRISNTVCPRASRSHAFLHRLESRRLVENCFAVAAVVAAPAVAEVGVSVAAVRWTVGLLSWSELALLQLPSHDGLLFQWFAFDT